MWIESESLLEAGIDGLMLWSDDSMSGLGLKSVGSRMAELLVSIAELSDRISQFKFKNGYYSWI